MTKPANIESIEKATGRSWSAWVDELDRQGARDMSHPDIADVVARSLDGQIDSAAWWTQAVTVAYEQHIGRRVPGQLADGSFELSVSRTAAASRDDLFVHVTDWLNSQAALNGHEVLKPRSSQTPKRSNWRCDFADKSKFSATVEGSGSRSRLVLSHTAIGSKQEADAWREYWRSVADQLANI